jgi:molecular chaperone DnaK
MAADNKVLGQFSLMGVPPAPRGVPQIEVSFDIDANGILNVKAADKGTGKEQKITITASSGLSEEEIEKMKKDAEDNADADKKKREGVEIKNLADTMVYTTEKMLDEHKDKVSDEDKTAVTEKLDALKVLKDSDDVEAIKTASEELSQVAQKIGAALYSQEEAAKGAEGSESAEKAEDVKDADFEEVKEEGGDEATE